jgi:hypothetical protein
MVASVMLKVLDVGGKDGLRARNEFYPGADVTVIDLEFGWDVMEEGLPRGNWDVILANHFIEHVSNPDYFLEECRNIMSPHTILDIGTPNLAAWFNRILFLFGYVPHSMELSTRFNVGKAFNWNDEGLGGHVYVYTVPALKQLLEHHGFKIISVHGEPSTYDAGPIISVVDKFFTKMNPNLASAFRIKCTI